MDVQDVTDIEANEKIVWSTTRLYLSLLETFPNYVQDFEAKWKDLQEAISHSAEFATPTSNHPSTR